MMIAEKRGCSGRVFAFIGVHSRLTSLFKPSDKIHFPTFSRIVGYVPGDEAI
jgi:hypothetical protein